MSGFPRTEVGGLSLSRMIVGSNWFMGYSHTSLAKDKFIRSYQDARKVADVLEVFLKHDIDTVMGLLSGSPVLEMAVQEAQQRTGRRLITIDTPALAVTPQGVDESKTAEILDRSMNLGATFCMPHQCTTDALIDRTTRRIRHMDRVCRMIREREMIPGLSTHMPETPVYADESGLDVETYIQIYNAAGFLMQVEVDWVHGIILKSQRPVMTIKPLAAGRLLPLVGLAFAWSTLRDCDMVTVGCMTPDEAYEDIEISLSIIERRIPQLDLQKTRSKQSVIKAPSGV